MAPPKRKRLDATVAPSKTVAAEFLRTIATAAHLPVADPAARAADLRIIADCIEGRAKWRKGLAHPFSEQQHVNHAAYMVEHRAPGESVDAALDRWAHQLAQRFGQVGPDDPEKLRGHIVAARKRQRKAGWPLVEK
jgi:hypothetical protein